MCGDPWTLPGVLRGAVSPRSVSRVCRGLVLAGRKGPSHPRLLLRERTFGLAPDSLGRVQGQGGGDLGKNTEDLEVRRVALQPDGVGPHSCKLPVLPSWVGYFMSLPRFLHQ